MKHQMTTMALIKNSILFLGTLTLLAGAYLSQEAVAASVLDQMEQSSGKQSTSATLAVIESPEVAVHVLESLLRSILYSVSVDTQSFVSEPQKRGLDLGISRGFSGSQAGKHLMGLSAASFANGPGR